MDFCQCYFCNAALSELLYVDCCFLMHSWLRYKQSQSTPVGHSDRWMQAALVQSALALEYSALNSKNWLGLAGSRQVSCHEVPLLWWQATRLCHFCAKNILSWQSNLSCPSLDNLHEINKIWWTVFPNLTIVMEQWLLMPKIFKNSNSTMSIFNIKHDKGMIFKSSSKNIVSDMLGSIGQT